jgi:thiol:disulfide interchange protein
MRRLLALIGLLLLAGLVSAQRLDPVKWSLVLEPTAAPAGGKVLARLHAKMDPGWHVYSLSTRGAIPTTIGLADHPAVDRVTVHVPSPKRAFDKNFNLETETYEGEATFLLAVEFKKDAPIGSSDLTAQVRYQACNEKQCLLPVKRAASATLTIDASAANAPVAVPAGYSEFKAGAVLPPEAPQNGPAKPPQEIGMFLLVAFGFGLAAIFTPCVFPMIPITMSFFLNRPSVTRRDSIFQAAVFCLGIIVLFSSIGLLITAALGPFGIIQLGGNPWVNGFIAIIFLILGLSLLGAFEITIPSSLLTKLDRASGRGGVAGSLLMGLTFCLTSFACVGPFIGTLLAASAQGGGLRPLLGMVTFASGLALPFFLLAVFPSYLKRMPRSGGWLARVKVVMGFFILAAMFKYLSSVDAVMQWGFLTRERFLAAWIVLIGLAGLYLLGFVRLEGISKDEPLGIPRLLIAATLLIVSISLIPGMFGGNLGELEAYVPLANSSGAPAGENPVVWLKNDYRESLEKARREGKMILVNFTGYACTNCHWMKRNMFPRPEIVSALRDLVLVELYTDGTDEASRLNQQLLETKFNIAAIPYYAILSPDEKVVASFPSLTRNPQEFLQFLKKGAPKSG